LSIELISLIAMAAFAQIDMVPDDPIYPADAETEAWFDVKEMSEGVWRIYDHGRDNIYLVAGEEKALLIDTGTGVADLKGLVESLAHLPVIVVNTHGHPDHCGGNHQFESVFAHPADFELVRRFNDPQSHAETIRQTRAEFPDLTEFIIHDEDSFTHAELYPVKDGFSFDLGNRSLEVIAVPGHTPGSICLLDSKEKLLFVGDNNNETVWLFLEGSLPVESYLKVLEKQDQRSDEFDWIMPGHGNPMAGDFIAEQIACATSILNGTCKGEPYETFAGSAKLCRYKRAGIAFDPENLWENESDR